MRVLMPAGLHLLMLLLLFFEHFRSSQTSLFGKMAKVTDDFPHFIFLEYALPCGHARRVNAIHDDPMQLAICVVLNIFGFQIGYRRGHLLREWNTRILTIESVANLAVMTEMFFSLLDTSWRIGNRVLVVFAADGDLLLHLGHHFTLNRPRTAYLASDGNEDDANQH